MKIEFKNGEYMLVHSERMDKLIKEHAFIYMDLFGITTQPYLKFLKQVVSNFEFNQ